MKKWERFTRQEIEQFVKESFSYAQLASKVGYSNKSGNSITLIKNMIEELDLDVSHLKGQGWNKNNFDYSRFQYGKKIKAANALDAIVVLRGHKCEKCGLSNWLNKPITLEVHHIDGDNLNNELDNLELLCPNCHSFTDNWRGKNIDTSVKIISDEDLVDALQNSASIRQALISVGLSAKGGNYSRAYELIYKNKIEKFLVGAPGQETSCVNDP